MWISRKEYEGLQTDSIRRIELEKEVERLSGLVPTHSECVLTKEEYDDLINDRKLKQRLEDEVDRLAKLITAEVKDCKIGPWCKNCKYIGTDVSSVCNPSSEFPWVIWKTAGRVQYCRKHLSEICPEFELKG